MTVTHISQVRELGIAPAIVEQWIAGFRVRGRADESADFQLTPLQRDVASSDAAFGTVRPNLVIAGPTSAGKTLAAEIVMAEALSRDSQRGCIFAVPLRVLATEKVERFRRVFGEDHVYVSSSDYQEHDLRILDPRRPFRVVVVVYEKLFGWLLGSAARDLLRRTSVLVVDELQVLSDPSRGPRLELLLAFVKHYNRDAARRGGEAERSRSVRMVGMGPSARALAPVARWLDAAMIARPEEERPVPLVEGYLRVVRGAPSELRLQPLPEILAAALGGARYELPTPTASDRDQLLVQFLDEMLRAPDGRRLPVGGGKRFLVYAGSKNRAERLARQIASVLGGRQPITETTKRELDAMEETTARDDIVQNLGAGVAFHHGDLNLDERTLVEGMFRGESPERCGLDVVTTTPTLGMGVNLPADFMIFASHTTYRLVDWEWAEAEAEPLTPLEYRNFAGRAGRLRPGSGPDHHGVALFITDMQEAEAEDQLVKRLIRRPVDELEPVLDRWPYGFTPIAVAGLLWLVLRPPYHANAHSIRAFFQDTLTGRSGRSVQLGAASVPLPEAAYRSVIEAHEADRQLVDIIDEQIEATGPTKALAKTGVHIESFRRLRQLQQRLPDVLRTPLVVIEALADLPEVAKLWPTKLPSGLGAARLAQGLRLFLGERKAAGVVLGPRCERLLERPEVPSDATFQAALRVTALCMWIEGTSYRQIVRSELLPEIRAGSIQVLSDQYAWYAMALMETWVQYGGASSGEEHAALVRDELAVFERRLRFGLPAELTPVAQLKAPGCHRSLLVQLWRESGGWEHPTEILSWTESDVTGRWKPLLRVLKQRIRQREWSDDPRDLPQRHRAAVVQSAETDRALRPWLPLVGGLHADTGASFRQTLRRALRTPPFDLDLRAVEGDRAADFALRITGGHVAVVVVDGNGTLDAVVGARGRLVHDAEEAVRTLVVVLGSIQFGEEEESRLRAWRRPVVVVTREALAALCVRAVAADEGWRDGGGRVVPIEQSVQAVLFEGPSGVLCGEADVDRMLDAQGNAPRVIGVLAGAGRVRGTTTRARPAVDGRIAQLRERAEWLRLAHSGEWSEKVAALVDGVQADPTGVGRELRVVIEALAREVAMRRLGERSTGLDEVRTALWKAGLIDAPLNSQVLNVQQTGNAVAHADRVTNQIPELGVEQAAALLDQAIQVTEALYRLLGDDAT